MIMLKNSKQVLVRICIVTINWDHNSSIEGGGMARIRACRTKEFLPRNFLQTIIGLTPMQFTSDIAENELQLLQIYNQTYLL